jgi:hypothetical protein
MAYIEKIMYSMTCDNCRKDICDNYTEFAAITPKEQVTEIANHAEWAIVDTDKGELYDRLVLLIEYNDLITAVRP